MTCIECPKLIHPERLAADTAGQDMLGHVLGQSQAAA